MDVKMPDGTVITNVPEDITQSQLLKMVNNTKMSSPEMFSAKSENPATSRPSLIESFNNDMARGQENIKQLELGALKGASNIGATLLSPIDYIMGIKGRREAVTGGLQGLGANPETSQYKMGQLASEIAGTAGIPGAMGKTLMKVAPSIAPLAEAIATSGMKAGNTTGLANLGTRMLGGGLSGGAMAGAIDPQSAKSGAAIGAVLPPVIQGVGAIGHGIGSITRKMFGEISPEVAQLAAKAQELGIDIPADRLVNSRPLNAAAASLNYVPLSGRSGTEAKMESQLNKALSNTFGQNTDNITMGLRKASTDLGNKFETTLKNNKVVIDKQFMNDLADNWDMASKELPPSDFKVIGNQIKTILQPYQGKAQVGDVIEGQAAYNIKKTLDRIGRRNTNDAFYARQVQKSLMGALNRSLGTDEAASFATVRKQYGNMLDLRSIAKNGAEGGISVARLANMHGINNPELQSIADIAAQFVKPQEAQHGAMQRVTLGLLGAGGAATGYAPAVVGGMLAGRGANSILNSDVMKNVLLNIPSKGLLSPSVEQLMYRTAPLLNAH